VRPTALWSGVLAGVLVADVAETSEVGAERLRRLKNLQQHFDALPVDEAMAVSFGRLAAAVVDAGRQPRGRVMDLLVAATAHSHGARLYTRNAGESSADALFAMARGLRMAPLVSRRRPARSPSDSKERSTS
jgi:predicted nucleic acid-binding protein